jgi:dihydroxyacid dehydratase/phosphogluconate dehydratase
MGWGLGSQCRYNVVDLDAVGGVPMVMKTLLNAGLIHGDCLTVTGKTVAENLADVAPAVGDFSRAHVISDRASLSHPSPLRTLRYHDVPVGDTRRQTIM